MTTTNPEDHVEEIIHIARAKDGTSIDGDLLMRMESELQESLRLAGDMAPRLMYQLADTEPVALDAFVRHHADHFVRRNIAGGEVEEVAAVLIRHAFIVGVLAAKALQRAGRS